MKNHIVIKNPEQCCGCAACANICPKNAISMKEDSAGFIFPEVDESLCVNCGRCIDVCVFSEKEKGAGDESEVFAAVNTEKDVLLQSSSGGIFTALANAVLDKSGAVFGAAWNNELGLEHICVQNKADLAKLRGSKYVQSSTGDCYRQAEEILKDGRTVCYCGTPCQIAGLKAYLGKEYENLYTIDLVCHGVPSTKMLHDDLKAVAGEKYSSIKNIKFRDKSRGWGVKGSLEFDNGSLKYHAGSSPYYFYFLKGEVYRESCYHCRFPGENRQGDITLGDYWGIKQDLIAKLGNINADEGVSCVLVNSEKGGKWLSEAKNISLAISDRNSAEKRNRQLTHHSEPLPEHETLLKGYIQGGYSAFEQGYKKHTKDHIVCFIKDLIPAKIKRKINDILH